jgi:phenylacetate-CoA ligase
LREVRGTGEALSPELRALCAEAWGVRVSELYSAAEIGLIAFPCPEQNLLHVQAEGVRLEVLRDDGTDCEPGEEGRVVLTPLHNFAMPLIRYEIGDRAVPAAPCACGRTLPALACIPGRARDMLTLPDGARRFPYYGHNAIMRVDAIAQHQVAQVAPDRVELRLVVRRPLDAEEAAHIVAVAEAALGPPFRAVIVYRDAIARQPGGKYAEFSNEVAAPA